ncbi:uncharacterized protein SAPINGB_P000069 [Magnusiomyces paraingens]|uniref:Uncharacterized protein n=1 Tax=Magnusiomyces paraingens TaxID=2606893 RepID=A0A5E8B2M4_9ASCO|nr:uncharacterized protein SAPINGB_P000069 [Saprochaete ingens]VVT43625.1 unnamed protein product [Saprochaete ingens]
MALSTSTSVSASASASKPEVTSFTSSNAIEKIDSPVESDIILAPLCTISQKKDLDAPVESDIILAPLCTIA